MIDDLMDEPEYDEASFEHDDRRQDSRVCHECHRETAMEVCGFCGNDLCPACFEMGAGFCSANHTQDQVDDYEHEVYGTSRDELGRRRQIRNELKGFGIL